MRQERHWKEEEENCEVEWEPRPQLLGAAGCQHLYERGKKKKKSFSHGAIRCHLQEQF